ncbi:MAG: formyltransferase family protein [Bacilli bacterium]
MSAQTSNHRQDTMKIIFAGKNKIGEICLKALQKSFDCIYIVDSNNESITKLKRRNDVIVTKIDDGDATVVFLAGWFEIIGKEQLKSRKYINIHGSLLPKYRGLHSLFWAIMNGEDHIGYTIHEINQEIDDGDIIYQYMVNYQGQTIMEINSAFYSDIDSKLGELIINYIDGNIILIKQDVEKASWVPKRNLNDCVIDFNMEYILLNRFFKALTYPYPLPRIVYCDCIYEVVESRIKERNYYCQLGRVVNSNDEGVWITIDKGFLIINKLRNILNGDEIQANELICIGYRFIK